mmetsp:Transcript_602/g.1366  ORF Transcript_602/g.1366 Transcript_602/m.1366 type:complete len:118 (+) Transcript_602:378-731(+)
MIIRGTRGSMERRPGAAWVYGAIRCCLGHYHAIRVTTTNTGFENSKVDSGQERRRRQLRHAATITTTTAHRVITTISSRQFPAASLARAAEKSGRIRQQARAASPEGSGKNPYTNDL